MKIRLKFAKKADAAFLGHLDIMRYFQRLFNRSGVKMEYSKGFNPHQLMSFAQPLGVGTLSDADYLDAEIADGQDLKKITDDMNKNCGTGFSVISVKELKPDAKSSMAMLRFSSYIVDITELEIPDDAVTSAVEDFLASEKAEVVKKTKKKESVVDIRPAVIKLEYLDGQLIMTVTSGSADNLKPDILTGLIVQKAGFDFSKGKIIIKRTEMYGEGMVPLDEYQTQ